MRTLSRRQVTVIRPRSEKRPTPGRDFMISNTSWICGCILTKEAWPPRPESLTGVEKSAARRC